jgi:hypothetical protein
VDSPQPLPVLRSEREALEAEVADLRKALARGEERLQRENLRGAPSTSYFWGVLFGMLALAAAGLWVYFMFATVTSLD